MTQTVIILKESDDRTLCLKFSGLVTRADHQTYLRHELEKIIARHGEYNLLILHDEDFRGWEPGAAESSLRSIIDFAGQSRRIAYVNPPEKKVLQTKLSQPLFNGEVKMFDRADYDAAVTWVKS